MSMNYLPMVVLFEYMLVIKTIVSNLSRRMCLAIEEREKSAGLDNIKTYSDFADRVKEIKRNILDRLDSNKAARKINCRLMVPRLKVTRS